MLHTTEVVLYDDTGSVWQGGRIMPPPTPDGYAVSWISGGARGRWQLSI